MDDKTVIIINGDECINYEALIDHFVNRELYTGYCINEYTAILNEVKTLYYYTRVTQKPYCHTLMPVGFINDLKTVYDKYHNLTMKYLMKEYDRFKTSNYHILFVYMDNFDDIDKFRDYILSKGGR